MRFVRLVALLTIALVFSACTGVSTGVYYGRGYGPGPYWGWGYGDTVIIDRPDPGLPDIDEPIAVPYPEVPDMGMPDFGGMDMDMGGMDMGGFDF